MKTFCIGDIHGAYPALLECFKLSGFDKARDRLICLGDVCDRGPMVKECIGELLTLSHCINILGNHDYWALKWALEGEIPESWTEQGGSYTLASYQGRPMPAAHVQFLKNSPNFWIEQNRLFVHGGFDPAQPVETTDQEILLWDRKMLLTAFELNALQPEHRFGHYEDIFVGHTPTLKFNTTLPQHFCNVWDLDTGAGWGAKLTIMDVDTKEYWQANAKF